MKVAGVGNFTSARVCSVAGIACSQCASIPSARDRSPSFAAPACSASLPITSAKASGLFGLNASVSLVALTPAIGKPSGGSDVVTLGAVADAYVRDGLAGTNFGTTADLSRRMRWGGRDTRT